MGWNPSISWTPSTDQITSAKLEDHDDNNLWHFAMGERMLLGSWGVGVGFAPPTGYALNGFHVEVEVGGTIATDYEYLISSGRWTASRIFGANTPIEPLVGYEDRTVPMKLYIAFVYNGSPTPVEIAWMANNNWTGEGPRGTQIPLVLPNEINARRFKYLSFINHVALSCVKLHWGGLSVEVWAHNSLWNQSWTSEPLTNPDKVYRKL